MASSNKHKLDYLSKYYGQNRKEKKKSKKNKKQTKELDEDAFLVVDNHDDDDEVLSSEHDDDDEGPVVVEVVPGTDSEQQVVLTNRTGPCSTERTRSQPTDNDGTRFPSRQRYRDEESQHPSDSPPPKRKRHDSEESKERHVHKQVARRTKYDSNDEPSFVKSGDDVRRHHHRTRHDSDDDEPRKDNDNQLQHRKRHDSDQEATNEGGGKPSSQRKKRYDADDTTEPRSKANETVDRTSTTRSSNKRYDSDDEPSSGSSSSSKSGGRRERMSSGHRAGLQTVEGFSRTEARMQQSRRAQAQTMVDQYGMGDTVYRDEKGRKVDQPVKTKKVAELTEQEQRVLHVGRVQRDHAQAQQQQMAEMQHSAFARHADDSRLEEIKKEDIREGDPMAMYAAKKKGSSKVAKHASADSQKPVYKGPRAKPNRFGIRPGFRWDGVDRGNGFEDRLLERQFSRQHQQEQSYRQSSADM